MVSLKPDHRPTTGYLEAILKIVAQEFPGVTFYSLPADMITQILNFGMPSPIDIEIEAANVSDNRVVANQIFDQGASSDGSGGRAHPAALRLPGLRDRRRPNQGATERANRARRRGQPTGNAERKLPDVALLRSSLTGKTGSTTSSWPRRRNTISSLCTIFGTFHHGLGSSQEILADVATISRGRRWRGRPLQHPPRRRHLCQGTGTRYFGGAGYHRIVEADGASCRAAVS